LSVICHAQLEPDLSSVTQKYVNESGLTAAGAARFADLI
jgi:hypothetical protein